MSGEYISGREGELCPEKCPDPLVYTGLSFTDSTATSHIYRAVQCIARTVLSKDICLSVRLSVFLTVTRRYCVETAKQHHQTFFTVGYPHLSRHVSQSFSVPLHVTRRVVYKRASTCLSPFFFLLTCVLVGT